VPDDNTFNLISARWIPVTRASGQRDKIRPEEITQGIDGDPIVDLDFPRPDFRCAALEFLIGLLAVACPPDADWVRLWNEPPTTSDLATAFAPLVPAFAFDGQGTLAYQDFEDFGAGLTPVEALLIDAPGANTIKKNTALLVKAGRVQTLSRSAAAIALMTLQAMAPTGGQGHRVSLRGGGPLTTLVVPRLSTTLWHRLWANVPVADEPATAADLPRIFPWLVPTRLSSTGGTTTPSDVDWRQAFFGMPRRIRLNFEPNEERVACDLTGETDDIIVRHYRTRQHGTNYEAWGGYHPLTPHYRAKASDPILYPVHGQGGHIAYRQWVAMIYGTKDASRIPAGCVSLFLAQRKDELRGDRSFRLMAAGYEMDNMKAVSFVEAETPDIRAPEGDTKLVAAKAWDFVAAADKAARALGQAIRMALYGSAEEIKADSTPLATAKDRFWAETNDRFFAILNAISLLPTSDLATTAMVSLASDWRILMERAVLAIFDDMAPIGDARGPEVKRVVEGRRFLVRTLRGYGPRGVELFKDLQLPVPEPKSRKDKAA
jgi:CRISPR system Cascade subunit CasA